MTEEGAIIGTAQYLSPEQARGAPVDQTSDLYSDGHRALRAPDRRSSVHGRQPGRDRDEASRGGSGDAVRAPTRRARGSRPRRRPRAGEGAGGPLPVGRCDGRRSRDGRARRSRRGRDGRRGHDGALRRTRRGRNGGDADGAPRTAAAVRASLAKPTDLALAARARRGACAARGRLVPLRLDPEPAARAPRPSPSPMSSASRKRGGEPDHRRQGPHPTVRANLQLRRRGGNRLRTEPDRGNACRQGDRRPDRRLVGQARGDRSRASSDRATRTPLRS